MLKRALVLAFIVAMLGLVLFAQQKEFTKEVKHVPVKQTSAASGKEMFNMYCAVCHGMTGKGGGPAADSLKTVPTDLTALTKNEGGKFLLHTWPALSVATSMCRLTAARTCQSGAISSGI
jgi:mono/diheme cytochrome c family protein